MDKDALQALYDDINNHPDKTLSTALLAQFKSERPDFKFKIDAKQFLQHVAYGEQDEAEKLLLEDPEVAQALLRTDKIPFTDYSGRTFNCTAYEYAYWAKDSHMQRMLEKYIRINEETRQLILHRVDEIEKRVPSAEPSGFFGRFFGPPTKPQGLYYTTKDKGGVVKEHQDAGFDLAPLIKALKNYVTEFNKKWRKTAADCEALDKIWIGEIGRAQREIPAHIAHEYCHPNRSFKDVNENNDLLNATTPSNLTRQLSFYDEDRESHKVWFSPNSYSDDSGLGFSFGIFRADRSCTSTTGSDQWVVPKNLSIDLATLETISKVRTQDRKQSRLNLRQPLTLQASQRPSLTVFSQ